MRIFCGKKRVFSFFYVFFGKKGNSSGGTNSKLDIFRTFVQKLGTLAKIVVNVVKFCVFCVFFMQKLLFLLRVAALCAQIFKKNLSAQKGPRWYTISV